MDDQLEAQNIVPQTLGVVNTVYACSFSRAFQVIESNTPDEQGIAFHGPFQYHTNFEEDKTLRLLPNAFDLNRTIQKLEISNVEVDDILITKAFRAALRKDRVTSIKFSDCNKVINQRLMETMCAGLKERSTGFQLELWKCSSEFVKPIIEASYLKCFSLMLWDMDWTTNRLSVKNMIYRGKLWYRDCTDIGRSITSLCYRGSMYYITLGYLKGLKEDFFLQLGKCLIPNLTTLSLGGTEVPTSALKRLIGSLKKILDSGRSSMFTHLDLGKTELDSRLSFASFQLLHSDLVVDFRLNVKEDISRAVVKSISSTVAKTKNLRLLYTLSFFSSGTNFNHFKLQEQTTQFGGPFGVNVYRIR